MVSVCLLGYGRTLQSNILRMCEQARQIGGPTLIHNTKWK